MNKWQQERSELFEHLTFSEEAQEQVLVTVSQNKSRKYFISAIVLVMAVTSFFLYFTQIYNQDTAKNVTAAYTKQSLQATFEQQRKLPVLEVVMPLTNEQDALVVAKYDAHTAWLQRAEFKNNVWTFNDVSFGLGYDVRVTNANYEIQNLMNESGYFVAGVVQEEKSDTIWIGNEQAKKVYLQNGHVLWYGTAKSNATPIFFEKDSIRQRVQPYNNYYSTAIPFVEAVGNQQVTTIFEDAMTRLGREYEEFPVVYDPNYYMDKQYEIGDVVLVKVDGKERITRILAAEPGEVKIEEGTVVINNQPLIDERYWGSWNKEDAIYYEDANTGLYIASEKYELHNTNEVFVMPDNWASKGLVGIIDKSMIAGKVIGYSKLDIGEQWSDKEYALYEAFAATLDTAVLKDASVHEVARIQRMAMLEEDYDAVYALYDEQTLTKSYEEWVKTSQVNMTEQLRGLILYEAYAINKATYEPDTKRLIWLDYKTDEMLFQLPVTKERTSWKLQYETIKYIR